MTSVTGAVARRLLPPTLLIVALVATGVILLSVAFVFAQSHGASALSVLMIATFLAGGALIGILALGTGRRR